MATQRIRARLHRPPVSARIASDGIRSISDRLLDSRLEERFQAGVQRGEEQAIEGAGQALERAADQFEEFIANSQQQVTAFAIGLAVDIAGHLLRRELDAQDYDIERLVRDTLAAGKVGRGQCKVHLSPSDYARLHGVPFRSGTQLISDPDIEPGNVQVETPQGLLVQDRDEALANIRDELLGQLA